MSVSADETQVRQLYDGFITQWNARNAAGLATLFASDANVVGFDGSQMNSSNEIASTLGEIFAHHQTAPYVGIVREVRWLSPDVAVLRAVVGMPNAERTDINPAVNAIQTMVAERDQAVWMIAVLQTTPAALHGRPDLAEQLTQELRQAWQDSKQN